MWFRKPAPKPAAPKPAAPVHPWWRLTVLHRYSYIDASYIIDRINHTRSVCTKESYLECLVSYKDVTEMTAEFARITKKPELEDPDVFVRVLESLPNGPDTDHESA